MFGLGCAGLAAGVIVPYLADDANLIVLGGAILMGIIWIPYGWAADDPVGLHHAIGRSVLSYACFLFAPAPYKASAISLLFCCPTRIASSGCESHNTDRKGGSLQGANLTVAVTGASGAILGRELLRALEADERVGRVHFVASENSLRVLAEELGVSGAIILEKLLGAAPRKTVQLSDANIGAAIASGSHPSGMIILPCSMGTLAAIANGLANSLISIAADVM